MKLASDTQTDRQTHTHTHPAPPHHHHHTAATFNCIHRHWRKQGAPILLPLRALHRLRLINGACAVIVHPPLLIVQQLVDAAPTAQQYVDNAHTHTRTHTRTQTYTYTHHSSSAWHRNTAEPLWANIGQPHRTAKPAQQHKLLLGSLMDFVVNTAAQTSVGQPHGFCGQLLRQGER